MIPNGIFHWKYTKKYRISYFVIHKSYKPKKDLTFDIALIRINGSMPIFNIKNFPIINPTTSQAFGEVDSDRVFGYGFNEKQNPSEILLEANIDVIAERLDLPPFCYPSELVVCYQGYSANPKQNPRPITTSGDKGGPVITRKYVKKGNNDELVAYLVGIHSGEYKTKDGSLLSFGTNVGYFHDWINYVKKLYERAPDNLLVHGIFRCCNNVTDDDVVYDTEDDYNYDYGIYYNENNDYDYEVVPLPH